MDAGLSNHVLMTKQRILKDTIDSLTIELSEADYDLSRLKRDLANAQLARERLVVKRLSAKKELSKLRHPGFPWALTSRGIKRIQD